jgi:hypothetical protein
VTHPTRFRDSLPNKWNYLLAIVTWVIAPLTENGRAQKRDLLTFQQAAYPAGSLLRGS